jgi:hypothetical protein
MTWSNLCCLRRISKTCMIWLQMRGGTIVPLQQAAMTTGEVRHSPLTLVVALQQQVIVRCHLCCEPMVCKHAVSKSISASLSCKHLPIVHIGAQAKACGQKICSAMGIELSSTAAPPLAWAGAV